MFLEIWRRASRFDRTRGSGTSWIMTLTHARAVDRVRSAQASSERETKAAQMGTERDVDTVVEQVESAFERRAVQRCLGTLTDLQRESITLAYYSGYTYREVGELLSTPLPTVKTRLRDGLDPAPRLPRSCPGGDPMTAPDLHLDTGAMALDALPDDERAAFVAHLDDCETCPPELAEFTETVARLAVLTAQRPPAGLKQRVLEAITTIPQLPPLTDGGRHRATDAAAEDTSEAERRRRSPTSSRCAPGIGAPRRWSRRPWWPSRCWSAVSWWPIGRPPASTAEQAQCVATAPDATVTRPTVGDVGEVRYAPSCGAATVDVTGIAAPPTGQQYQMWFIAGQTITSAGLMSPGCGLARVAHGHRPGERPVGADRDHRRADGWFGAADVRSALGGADPVLTPAAGAGIGPVAGSTGELG